MLPMGWTGRQAGLASWYGPGFYGRRTASGVVYTGAALTAAHRSLPFGTVVRVTNLENGRRVMVVIDDRGPFIRGRVIDLSVTAAQRLGMVRDGVVPVRIKVVRWAEEPEV
jgi:rare lipoprotein A